MCALSALQVDPGHHTIDYQTKGNVFDFKGAYAWDDFGFTTPRARKLFN